MIDFSTECIDRINKFLKSSLALPSNDLLEDVPELKKLGKGVGSKVLNEMQKLIEKIHGVGNILDKTQKKTLDEKFDVIVEINDKLLDKCSRTINKLNNPTAFEIESNIIPKQNNYMQKRLHEISTDKSKAVIEKLAKMKVDKPQINFKKAPDNTLNPFRPILSCKPNAKVELHDVISQNNSSDSYEHPYKRELDEYKIPESQLILSNETPEFPKSLGDTNYELITTLPKLKNLINTLKSVDRFSVDLEHHSYRTYLGITCLMQISTKTEDFIIDTLSLHDEMEICNEVFTDPKIEKIFHGSSSDLMWLQRDFGVYIVNLFDTGIACNLLNFPKKSLSYLLDKYCQYQASKEYQLIDWRIRPLLPEIEEYARSDTHYLIYISELMKRELVAIGQLQKSYKQAHSMCYTLYHKPKINDLNSENFNEHQKYALKGLLELRDKIAREEDESAEYVLPNRSLLNMAKQMPKEVNKVMACGDSNKVLLQKYKMDFCKVCLDAANVKFDNIKVEKNIRFFDYQQYELNRKFSQSNLDEDSSEDSAHEYSQAPIEICVEESDFKFERGESNNLFQRNSVFSEDQTVFLTHFLDNETNIGLKRRQRIQEATQNEEKKRLEKVIELTVPEQMVLDESKVPESTQSVARPGVKSKIIEQPATFDYSKASQALKNKITKRKTDKTSYNPCEVKKFKNNKQ